MPDGKLPALDGRRVVRALARAGSWLIGSSAVIARWSSPGDATRTVTAPVHPGRDLKPGALPSIIWQARFKVGVQETALIIRSDYLSGLRPHPDQELYVHDMFEMVFRVAEKGA
jgi:hypothetical protein